jgi:hypothetical protein
VITQPCLPDPERAGHSLQGIAEPQHLHATSEGEHTKTHGEAMTNIDPRELVARYVAVWNEPDAGLRRKAIHDLWTEDGAHILQPPQEIRKAATGLGFTSTTLEAHGHDELEVRVTRAYQEIVAPGEFAFKPRDNADRLHNIVKFNWTMIPSSGGEVAGAGLEILVLDEDGRIKTDYQFIEG